jgi:hypothetical protein
VVVGVAALAVAGCGKRLDATLPGDDGSSAGEGGTTAAGDDGESGAGSGVVGGGGPSDGGVFMMGDATTATFDGGGTCDLGAASSIATTATLNLFGDVVYYLDGGALPPGHTA